jgi:hypothetical protein
VAKKPLRLDEWLTLDEVEAALPAMRHFDAARVARGDQQSTQTGDGFLPNYRKAKGSKAKMKKRQARTNETWFDRRNNFVKRHMAQARKNRENLFHNGIPSKRMLGLIAWAYVPPEWDDAYAEWVESGWSVKPKNRRNGPFLPPLRSIPRPQYDTGYGPWTLEITDFVPMGYLHRLAPPGRLTEPVDFDINEFPEGTWFKDKFSGNYGRNIYELVWVNPEDIVPTELIDDDISPERRKYIQPYIDWIQEGHQPPPVRLIEAENGDLRLTDGHRRYIASRTLGVPLLAIVSYAVPTGSVDTQGRPIKTGLTAEIARQDADLIGRMDPFYAKNIRKWEKDKKPELVARRKALTTGVPRRNGSTWDRPQRPGSTVQSIIFDRDVWEAREAKQWLREHGYSAPKVDRKPNVLRFRQHDPSLFYKDSFRTIPFGDNTGIQAIVAIPR